MGVCCGDVPARPRVCARGFLGRVRFLSSVFSPCWHLARQQDGAPWQVTKTEWVAGRPRHPDLPVRNPLVREWEAVEEVGEQVSGRSPRPRCSLGPSVVVRGRLGHASPLLLDRHHPRVPSPSLRDLCLPSNPTFSPVSVPVHTHLTPLRVTRSAPAHLSLGWLPLAQE